MATNSVFLTLSHIALFGGALLVGSLLFQDPKKREQEKATTSSRVNDEGSGSATLDVILGGALGQDEPLPWQLASGDLSFSEASAHELEKLYANLPEVYLSSEGHLYSARFDPYTHLFLTGSQQEDLALFEAALRSWLKKDAEAALEFLAEKLGKFQLDQSLIAFSILRPVAEELILAGKECPWISRLGASFRYRLRASLLEKGVTVFSKEEFGNEEAFAGLKEIPGLGITLGFEDRELLVHSIFEGKDKGRGYFPVYKLREFLQNPELPGTETLAWMEELRLRKVVPESVSAEVDRIFSEWIRSRDDLSFHDRVEFLTNRKTARNDQFRFLAEDDVYAYFDESRDWRYEFRHGKVTATEVWEEVLRAKPELYEHERSLVGAREVVFRELAEEDPERAQVLLQDLSDSERAESLFHATWTSFVNVNPQRLLDYTQSLPPVEEKWQRGLINRGWDHQIRPQMNRLGEDYIEWARQMPSGPDREKVVDSVIWWVGQKDRARGEALRRELKGADQE